MLITVYAFMLLGWILFGDMTNGSQRFNVAHSQKQPSSSLGRKHTEHARKTFRDAVRGDLPRGGTFLANAYYRWLQCHSQPLNDPNQPFTVFVSDLWLGDHTEHYSTHIYYGPLVNLPLYNSPDVLSVFTSRFPNVPIYIETVLRLPQGIRQFQFIPGILTEKDKDMLQRRRIDGYQVWIGEHCGYREKKYKDAPNVALVDRCFVLLLARDPQHFDVKL